MVGGVSRSHTVPAEDITEPQRSAFRRYLDAHRRNDECSRTPLRLALVLGGMKPATIVDPFPWAFPDCSQEPVQCLEELIDLFECVYRRAYGASGLIVARSTGRVGFLPTVQNTDSDAYHRRLGVVFGYPPDAIEHFIQHEGPRTQPRELVKAGVFTAAELAYTSFVFYLPEESQAGYERAIASGKATRTRLTTLAHEWDLPVLAKLADTVYEAHVALYAGEATSV
jgi:hypothetical protein